MLLQHVLLFVVMVCCFLFGHVFSTMGGNKLMVSVLFWLDFALDMGGRVFLLLFATYLFHLVRVLLPPSFVWFFAACKESERLINAMKYLLLISREMNEHNIYAEFSYHNWAQWIEIWKEICQNVCRIVPDEWMQHSVALHWGEQPTLLYSARYSPTFCIWSMMKHCL